MRCRPYRSQPLTCEAPLTGLDELCALGLPGQLGGGSGLRPPPRASASFHPGKVILPLGGRLDADLKRTERPPVLAHAVRLGPLQTVYGTWEPEGRRTGGLKVLRDFSSGPDTCLLAGSLG